MTVEDVMLYGRIYAHAQARTYNEIISRIAACPHCGADIDEHCLGQYGRRHPGSTHSDRRTAAEVWRKANRDEYEQLKQDLIRYFVELSILEIRR